MQGAELGEGGERKARREGGHAQRYPTGARAADKVVHDVYVKAADGAAVALGVACGGDVGVETDVDAGEGCAGLAPLPEEEGAALDIDLLAVPPDLDSGCEQVSRTGW